jgi:spermidine/putrescine transport system permease protein
MADCDPQLEEAAADLGAGPWLTFRHVTLPLMMPGIVAGSLLAFTLSLDDFVVSFFTSGPGATTLPILIYSSVKRGLTPEVHALASLIVVVSAASVITVAILRGRSQVRR